MSETRSTELGDQLERRVEEALAVASQPQSVPVNVYETEGAVVVVAPLAGVMADDVKVVVVSGEVSITARMRTPAPKEYLVHEWHYGPYARQVAVPPGYGAGAQASFGNGQLAVRLPRGGPTGVIRIVPD